METALVLTRFVQFAAAMVLGGTPLFFLYGPPPPRAAWPGRLAGAAAAAGIVAIVGWLMAQAALFGDGPADAFDLPKVWSVATETGVGRAALVRIALFGAALAASRLAGAERSTWLAPAALGGVLAGSLAWLGHGRAGDGVAGAIHLVADIAHLVAAGVWLGALAPLAVLVLRRPGSDPEAERKDAQAGLESFSGIGPIVVATLVASGLVNGWFLAGPQHIVDLGSSAWGVGMIVKLTLFAAMLLLAAANRYILTPALADNGGVGALKLSILCENLLGLGVLAAVSVLGTQSPPLS